MDIEFHSVERQIDVGRDIDHRKLTPMRLLMNGNPVTGSDTWKPDTARVQVRSRSDLTTCLLMGVSANNPVEAELPYFAGGQVHDYVI